MDARLRHRLEYVGYAAVSAFFGSLPVRLASSVGASTFGLVGPMSRVRHPRLLSNLAKAFPDMSNVEVGRLANGVWRNLGRTFGEFFHLGKLGDVEIIGGDVLDRAVASGNGIVLCGSHQTNWEAGAAVASGRGLRVMGVYRHMRNRFVDADVMTRRAPIYAGGLVSKLDPGTPMQGMRHLRSGGALAIMVDQRMDDGQRVSFFGSDTNVTVYPAFAARQCRVPLVMVTGERLPNYRLVARFEEIPVPRTGDKAADIRQATASIHAALEASIARAPEQWMWTHRRWN